MFTNVCKICGENFLTRKATKQFCSQRCRVISKRKGSDPGQICWECKNAKCGCSWTKNLIPVRGWDAEATINPDKEGAFRTYKINKCPEFIKE